MLARLSLVVDIIKRKRAAGNTAEECLTAIRMVSIDLETEVVEGHRQRQEGLALERNHHTEE